MHRCEHAKNGKTDTNFKTNLALVVSYDPVNFHEGILKNSIRDARTPQPGEIFFNTMRYRSSVIVQSSRYFQSSVSYIKVQIMLK